MNDGILKPICFIAARGGSKGVPNKNIKSIAGKPLIAHSIRKIINSGLFQSVIVSTESPKIAKIAKKFGAQVPFLRPKKLAGDSATMDDVFLHAIPELQKFGYNFNVVVNLDCTAPFVKINDIKKSISLINKKKCNTAVGAYKTHLNPYFNMMEFQTNGFLKFSKKKDVKISTRQSAPTVFQLTGFQTFSVTDFLHYRRIYMPKTLPVELEQETGLMIDTQWEFNVAKCLFKNSN